MVRPPRSRVQVWCGVKPRGGWWPARGVRTTILLAEGMFAMGKAAAAIELGPVERREPDSLAREQKIRQAMARRARLVLAAAPGLEKVTRAAAGADASTVGGWRRRLAALGWTICPTSRGPQRRAGSVVTRSPAPSGSRSRPCRPAPHTGRCARWPRRSAARQGPLDLCSQPGLRGIDPAQRHRPPAVRASPGRHGPARSCHEPRSSSLPEAEKQGPPFSEEAKKTLHIELRAYKCRRSPMGKDSLVLSFRRKHAVFLR